MAGAARRTAAVASALSLSRPHLRPLESRCFTAPPLFIFHHANAYETDGGRRLIIDSIHYDSLPAVGREALAEQQASGYCHSGCAGLCPQHASVQCTEQATVCL